MTDFKRLRNDLSDYFGTAMFAASPLAVMDMAKVEKASDAELILLAKKAGFDLAKYTKEEGKR